jgi:phospholipid/cholesterol/gamma-HCH transport system substrate-binding protein
MTGSSLTGTVVRIVAFLLVCALFTFALMAVFAQFRFEKQDTYHAVFADVSGLKSGQFVRIAGVEVGKVTALKIQDDSSVVVTFGTDQSVVLTEGNRAVIRYDDLIGGRYLSLEEGAGETRRLRPGDTIPLAQTSPALDLDALIGGFRPLFRALDPDQVNKLSSELIAALQGQGSSIGSFFTHTAELTDTLADRDELIGQVIHNLHTVVGSFAAQNAQLDKAVDSLSQVAEALAHHRTDISNAVAYVNESARGVADLLVQARPPFQKSVKEADRVSSIAVADHDYLDNLLKTLPDTYGLLARQGLYGDFFSFYLCDLILKLNGKGGQPVYVKVAGQPTGRCAPK